jgi:hypothetical protein
MAEQRAQWWQRAVLWFEMPDKPPAPAPSLKTTAVANWFFELLHRLLLIGAVAYAAEETHMLVLKILRLVAMFFLIAWLAQSSVNAVFSQIDMWALRDRTHRFQVALVAAIAIVASLFLGALLWGATLAALEVLSARAG